MRVGLRPLGEQVREILRLDDAPWRIALALSVGVFISFTPFWGLQTVLSLVIATLCRLNKAATVAGTWLHLPWFAPFVYGGALKLGSLLLPGLGGLSGLSVVLLVGTTILGFVAGAITFAVTLGLIARRGRRAGADRRSRRRAA